MSELDSKKESNTTLRVWIAILTGLIVAIMKGILDSKSFGLLSIIGLASVIFIVFAIIAIQKAINSNTEDIKELD
jgi:uncharacterized membrane protein YhiD involved in acid resistance